MTDAAAMLIQASEGFAHSIVTLKEARNVRYADFVRPGRVLTVTAEILKLEPGEVQLKAQGRLADRVAVSGRLILARYNLADTRPEMAPTDAYLKRHLKSQLALVYRGADEIVAPRDPALMAPYNGTAHPT